MLELALVAVGLAAGLVIGRWWALLAAAAFGLWIGLETEVDEVPPWFLGLAYGLLAGTGIVAGVLVRRSLR